MPEKNLDFDKHVDRKETDCLKYDFAVRRGKPENVLPYWVADMDFMTSSYVTDALKERAEHGIFGYTEGRERYFDAVRGWMEKQHGWHVERNWLIETPGVVFALAMAVKAYTDEGDYVMINQPVYYPFSEVIRDNGRKIISSDLVLDEKDGKYHIDFDDLEKKITENKVKLYLLCSPHNPVGRVWTEEELRKIGDICVRNGCIVVSDEIHSDFVYEPNVHHVFASLSEEFSDISIVCTAPSKTFNIAGLQISNIFIKNQSLRRRFRHEVNAAGYSQPNAMGVAACQAAYENGYEWYRGVLKYIEGNIDFLRKYIKEELPQIKMTEPEGTYLIWLDFRGLGLSENELEDLIVNKAGLWLDAGAVFGKSGEGFERINVACSRDFLKTGLDRLKGAIYTH